MADEDTSHPLDGSSDPDSYDIVSSTELNNTVEFNQTSNEPHQGDIHQVDDEQNIDLNQDNQQAEKESLRKKDKKCCKKLRKKRYSDVVINTQPSHTVTTGKNKHNKRKDSTESYNGFVCCFLANSNDNDSEKCCGNCCGSTCLDGFGNCFENCVCPSCDCDCECPSFDCGYECPSFDCGYECPSFDCDCECGDCEGFDGFDFDAGSTGS